MAEENETPQNVEQNVEQAPEEQVETPSQNDDGQDVNKDDELPEWARKQIEKANREAANYRTQLRSAQEQLANAKDPEDFDKLRKQLEEVQATYERDTLIYKHTKDLPDELVRADWIKWPDDEKGIEAVSEQLRAMSKQASRTVSTADLKGGLNPNSSDNEAYHDDENWRRHSQAIPRR